MDDPERSRAYHRRQFRLSALGFAVTVAYLIAWLATGGNVALRDALGAFTPHWWLQVPLALLVLGIGHRLVTLPLSWVSGFLLPRRFGLLHQPFRLWLADVAKAGAIADAARHRGHARRVRAPARDRLVVALGRPALSPGLCPARPRRSHAVDPALLPAHPAPGWRSPGARAAGGGARRSSGARRLGRRPVAQEPDRERRRGGTGPHPAHPALRHPAQRARRRRDRDGARSRARPPGSQ